MTDNDYSPFWDDPLHDEREEIRALHNESRGLDPDRPTRAELAEDEAEFTKLLREQNSRFTALPTRRNDATLPVQPTHHTNKES